MKNYDTYSVFRMNTTMRDQLKTLASNQSKSSSALIREGVEGVIKNAEIQKQEERMLNSFLT